MLANAILSTRLGKRATLLAVLAVVAVQLQPGAADATTRTNTASYVGWNESFTTYREGSGPSACIAHLGEACLYPDNSAPSPTVWRSVDIEINDVRSPQVAGYYYLWQMVCGPEICRNEIKARGGFCHSAAVPVPPVPFDDDLGGYPTSNVNVYVLGPRGTSQYCGGAATDLAGGAKGSVTAIWTS